MAHQWFREGTDVEVASSIHSLGGVFFPGKVVAPSFDDANKFLVEYETLTTEENGTSQPLSEDVNVGQLRPRPPKEARLGFECGESVDAFFNGGWWEGVVSESPRNSCYLVHLKSLKQSYQFKDSDLRVHREWIRGTWSPPYKEAVKQEADDEQLPAKRSKKRALPECFGKGDLVEVRSDEEGLKGAWYGATIIDKAGKDKLVVEYLSLQAENGGTYLREEVDASHLRPHPLDTLVLDAYGRNDQVDAFYNDGWWEGRILKVLDGSKYRIYFQGTDDVMVFHHLDLRPHQDWVDGRWVRSSGKNQGRKRRRTA